MNMQMPPAEFRDDVPVTALCNTPDEAIFRNIAINAKRSIPWLVERAAHDRVAVIVGGGPSLARTIEHVRAHKAAGHDIFALNGAAGYLVAHGIQARYQVVIDSRPENIRLVADFPAASYIISSQCDPWLFDHLVDHDVMILFPAIEGIRDHIPLGSTATLIGGGITAGLTAMAAVYTLGYREIHLHGYDSSDAEDGQSHAYAQGETDAEKKRLEPWVAGRRFRCSFAMYKQAQEFQRFAEMLAEAGAEIHVHGDGLLPTIAREMTKVTDPSCAIYDLASAPASFDFIPWLVHADMVRRSAGCAESLRVHFAAGPREGFRNDALPLDTAGRQRFLDHVMRPALALFGASEEPYEILMKAPSRYPAYTIGPVTALAKCGDDVPRCTVPEHAIETMQAWLGARGIEHPIVITLREASHWPNRNSNVREWARFADWLYQAGEHVVFVRDTEKAGEPLRNEWTCPAAAVELHARVALYSLAKCVFTACNGPFSLPLFSDWPWLSFNWMDPTGEYPPMSDGWWRQNHGIGEGEQFPWSKPWQRIVWEKDTYLAMRDAWDNIKPALDAKGQ